MIQHISEVQKTQNMKILKLATTRFNFLSIRDRQSCRVYGPNVTLLYKEDCPKKKLIIDNNLQKC